MKLYPGNRSYRKQENSLFRVLFRVGPFENAGRCFRQDRIDCSDRLMIRSSIPSRKTAIQKTVLPEEGILNNFGECIIFVNRRENAFSDAAAVRDRRASVRRITV